ncbi:MAG: DUF1538 family protein, partial [Alphaproteobacteria bacterium]
MAWLVELARTFSATLFDVLPIAAILFGFQALVLRQPLPHLHRLIAGFFYVALGLAMFLVGLEQALFPLGKTMARQLSAFAFV